jgi:sugar phosphate isomerase/epimerase
MAWRFAVSTLGMPGVPLAAAVRTAAAHGCEGIELRNVDLPAETRAIVADAGLVISCLASYAKVCAPGPDAPVVSELRELVALAHDLGAPAIRVFPGGEGDPYPRIAAVLDDLRTAGVQLLVETHDSHPTGAAALSIVEPIAQPDVVGVLWDAVHPWRNGESPSHTRSVLAQYLRYFQVKDARASDPTPLPPGYGEVPLPECAEVLADWSGWISLEWEKAWYPDIPPVEVALRAAARWFASVG